MIKGICMTFLIFYIQSFKHFYHIYNMKNYYKIPNINDLIYELIKNRENDNK